MQMVLITNKFTFKIVPLIYKKILFKKAVNNHFPIDIKYFYKQHCALKSLNLASKGIPRLLNYINKLGNKQSIKTLWCPVSLTSSILVKTCSLLQYNEYMALLTRLVINRCNLILYCEP